jgi:acetyl/propionyl-CoA carboxylase alpha subunit
MDSGIADGAQITPYYDPLLAKIIAHGCNRETAIRRMQGALATTRIEGLHTNITLHQQIMDHPQFQAGAVDTNFLMRMLNP